VLITRRQLLVHATATAALLSDTLNRHIPGWDAFAQVRGDWDQGLVFHVLPTVSHDRILLKLSLTEAQSGAPALVVGGRKIAGARTDSRGFFWEFDIQDLAPARPYRLELRSDRGRSLAEPWTISTFPDPGSTVDRVRIVFFTCAGGHDALLANDITQPLAVRRALLARAIAEQPHAIVANGDHVYWDLLSPASSSLGASAAGIAFAGTLDRTQPILGSRNEDFLIKAAGEQIAPLYRTSCRSIPVFFVRDDHDYFDNDTASDRLITFPPSDHMMRLARATQQLYYPEFLPDANRPLGLAGTGESGRPAQVSQSYGTLRYGNLLEVLLYDNRRTGTMHGPSAVFVDPEVEKWLIGRMRARDTVHVVNAPGLPPGWTKGNWYEWYPDRIEEGKPTVATPKPYWQPGWLAQHDRLIEAMHGMRGRIPLIVSGDIHAIAVGTISRCGRLDLSSNPVVSVLPGPVGTDGTAWPRAVEHPNQLDVTDRWTPIRENGFAVLDFFRERIEVALFRWNGQQQSVADIPALEPFAQIVLAPVN
jgi:hypothetical protein